MAERLRYTAQPVAKPSARDELESLIETLHVSGTFRVLQGLTGQFAQVSGVALDYLNAPHGRRVIGSFALLAEVLSRLPAEKLEGIAKGIEKGAERAGESLSGEPPSTFQLLKLARDPDVRHAMAALLAILKSVGQALEKDEQRGS